MQSAKSDTVTRQERHLMLRHGNAFSNEAGASIAFVPISLPLMFSPGAIATIIVMASTTKELSRKILFVVTIAARSWRLCFVTYLCLANARRLTHKIEPWGSTRPPSIVGFFVSAISVGFIFDGVIQALQMHGLTSLH